jgi:hypothetical protein
LHAVEPGRCCSMRDTFVSSMARAPQLLNHWNKCVHRDPVG